MSVSEAILRFEFSLNLGKEEDTFKYFLYYNIPSRRTFLHADTQKTNSMEKCLLGKK